MAQQLASGDYHLKPMRVIQKANGDTRALWDSDDAVVIHMLTQYLTPRIPVHSRCEHVKGHGGGKASVQALHQVITSTDAAFVYRTDIKGYYANINNQQLLEQLRPYVDDAIVLNLLYQFLHYSVEKSGVFHTPTKGIARSSALSPLLAAFHLYCIDEYFASQTEGYYARYMDDFVILTRTRWSLKRAIRNLNQYLAAFGFNTHPDKTFIGRLHKGFDWMGFWFTHIGVTDVAPRALAKRVMTLRRLYEQIQNLPAAKQVERMTSYHTRWERWKNTVLLYSPVDVRHMLL
ncbi:reverse transcriptase domain-containing protein [Shewanella frigidimarina]|uniref:reverse transcriptase domain-containing protein n=1 Tax=Shewanella frigidimarina TaxID=56812 RepID=UPI00316C5C72